MTCSKCGANKAETSFYKRKDRPRGRHSSCKECNSNKDLPWNNRQHRNAIVRKSRYRLRQEVLSHYSGGALECACCKDSTSEFLTIDHIDGGGRKHRDTISGSVYRDLRKNNYPEGYQVLCYNCNCGREKNNGICPHKEI